VSSEPPPVASPSLTSSLVGDDERKWLQSQYAEIATLAGGLAHEIKNPLSTISLNLELLAEDITGDQPRDQRMLRKVKTVQRECTRLEQLLEDFLRFARAGALEFEETDLNDEVERFVEFFQAEARSARVELSPHLAADLPHVRLDRDRFRQVLVNLARNAREAMPAGGLLELQTNRTSDGVELRLIDTGVGMSPETLARVWDTFFSTKSGGSGLGLPTVRKIIERHGGRVSVESEPGRGTRFTIALPGVVKND
jgi:two-component system, NtrC family, sensor histidine kinase HydH